MQKKIFHISHLLILLFSSIIISSCWHENLDNCWKGDAILSITAERFQQAPDAPSETDMAAHIKHFNYYLFNLTSETIVKQGEVNQNQIQGDHYNLVFPTLPFGNYTLALIANSENLPESIQSWKDLVLRYSPTSNLNYFTSLYSFQIDCECGYKDIIKLYRTKGIISIKLDKVPNNLTKAVVEVTHTSETCLPDTTYQGDISVMNELKLTQENDSKNVINIDAFPTSNGLQSEVILTFYMQDGNGEEIVAYKKRLESPIQILRNQVTGVYLNFNYDISLSPTISIIINPEWEGINDDTNVEID